MMDGWRMRVDGEEWENGMRAIRREEKTSNAESSSITYVTS